MTEVYPASHTRIDRSAAHERAATEAMIAEDYKAAAQHYEQGYADNPCKLGFLMLLSDAHLRNGDPARVLDALERYGTDRTRYDELMRRPPRRLELKKAQPRALADARDEHLREQAHLQRRYEELDGLVSRLLGKQGAQTALYLVQARISLFLGDLTTALDGLESYQRLSPKAADPRVADSYHRIEAALLREPARPESQDLLGRVLVGLFLHQRATGEIPTESFLARAVDAYSRHATAAGGLLGAPQRAQQRYHTLRGLLQAACEADKSRHLPALYLARITHLDGDSQGAHALCTAHLTTANLDAVPSDEADKLRRWCKAVVPVPPPRCGKTCKIAIGIASGAGAVALGLGLGLGLGLRHNTQVLSYPAALTIPGGAR